MNCNQCGRELREDSYFCDQCGAKIEPKPEEKTENRFNFRILLGGLVFSVFITLLITGLAQVLGIPLIFGGLFLPFFWWRISKKQGGKTT